jgi:hypothetical protein
MYYETTLNLHNHTTYSDGHGSYQDIADAAASAGIDAVIITDHNIRPRGLEKYYTTADRKILILTGEEIHDRTRRPQKNHLLVFGVEQELTQLSSDTQWLIDRIRQLNGFAFLAHPNEDALAFFGEPEISWVDWDIRGFNGLEIWNGMSEFKTVVHSSPLLALLYAYLPHLVAHGAHPKTLNQWDEILLENRYVLAIGGTDSHAIPFKRGPFSRIIFPYAFHYSTVNNHILTEQPMTGNFQVDRQSLFTAIRRGHYYIGYDMPQKTNGFRFTAKGQHAEYMMGDIAENEKNLTLQIHLPYPATCHLIHNGKRIQTWQQEICTYQASEQGFYRIECTVPFWGKQRGWIYSNPIFFSKQVNVERQ